MDSRIKEAMQHPDVLGAGATKRKKLKPFERLHAILSEFKRGTLRSGSGEHVKNPSQAKAIALSESGKNKPK